MSFKGLDRIWNNALISMNLTSNKSSEDTEEVADNSMFIRYRWYCFVLLMFSLLNFSAMMRYLMLKDVYCALPGVICFACLGISYYIFNEHNKDNNF